MNKREKQQAIKDLALRLDLELGSPTPLLDEISEKYLGMTPTTAQRRANEGQLPFPTTTLTDKKTSPKLVSTDDLAKTIIERKIQAQNDHNGLRRA